MTDQISPMQSRPETNWPRVVTVTLAFRGSPTAVDDHDLAERIAQDLRDAGYEPNLLAVSVHRLPEAIARPWERP